ncbi:hypothetical protein FRB94_001758 [Tulasnella sp. JGI-2019a]|nr:hypothetical protein FRB94_001758 [Tulasnella sp. JGI-2019a]KAG9037766.1 hypothetical protein FRB95_004052 [Tulasnella sp. JGI-2019a]
MTTLSLLDVTERLRHNLACVRQAAEPTLKRQHADQTAGPFTDAILANKPLITYLRDAVPGEARLLTVHTGNETDREGGGNSGGSGGQTNGRETPQEDVLPEVATLDRRQIVSATPLRRRKEVGPYGESGDLFLKSALKLVDRYNVMPEKRGYIVEMLDRYYELEPQIKQLQQTVSRLSAEIPANQQQQTDDYISAKQAELAVREMEGKVAEARAKRDALQAKVHDLRNPGSITAKSSRTPMAAPPADMSLISATDTMSTPLMDQTIPSGLNFGNNLFSSIIRAPEASTDADEQEFWTGKRLPVRALSLVPAPASEADDSTSTAEKTSENGETDEVGAEDEDDEEDGDTTVLLSFVPRDEDPPEMESPERSVPGRGVPILPPPPSPPPVARARTPPSPQPRNLDPPREKPRAKPVDIVREVSNTTQEQSWSPTAQMEDVVHKLWVTVGEVILPGHKYDVGLGKGDSSPPKAVETASILRKQTIAQNTTSNTALTARLLLTLLTSPPTDTSSPLPGPVTMASLKTTVDTLAAERGFGKDLGAKTVYGCVAKKLLKIDRRSKEPTVAFDF